MQMIPLYAHPGDFAIVDDEDYNALRSYRWLLCNGYVRRWVGGGYLWLQHEVAMRMNMPIPYGYEIDHIDRLPLNNTRSNLRVVTRNVNNFNRSYYLRRFDPYVSPS
jgi:hypothetical protein